jgi:hypothetical protein
MSTFSLIVTLNGILFFPFFLPFKTVDILSIIKMLKMKIGRNKRVLIQYWNKCQTIFSLMIQQTWNFICLNSNLLIQASLILWLFQTIWTFFLFLFSLNTQSFMVRSMQLSQQNILEGNNRESFWKVKRKFMESLKMKSYSFQCLLWWISDNWCLN